MTPLARVRHRASHRCRCDEPADAHHSARYAGGPGRHHGDAEELLASEPAVGRARCRSRSASCGSLFLVLGRRFEEAFDLLGGVGMERGAPARHPRAPASRAEGAPREGPHAAPLHGVGGSAPAAMVPDRRARSWKNSARSSERRGPARRRDVCGIARPRSWARTRSSWVRSSASLVGAVAIRSLPGPGVLAGGVLPALPVARVRLLRRARLRVPDHAVGRPARREPGAGRDGRALDAALREHLARPEGDPAGRARSLAAVLMYRAAVRLTGRPGPSVVAAAAYVASAILLWSFSQGRLDLLVALAVLPAALERLEVAFGGDEPADGRWRFVVGVAVTFAVLMAFLPGAILAVLVIVVVQLLTARERRPRAGPHARVRRRRGHPVAAVRAHADRRRRGGASPRTWARRTSAARAPGLRARAGHLGRRGASCPSPRSSRSRSSGPRYRGAALRCAWRPLAGLALSWLSAAGYLPSRRVEPARLRRARGGGRGARHRLRAGVGPHRPGARVLRSAADRHGAAGRRPVRRDRPAGHLRDGRRLGRGRPRAGAGGVGRRAERRPRGFPRAVGGRERRAAVPRARRRPRGRRGRRRRHAAVRAHGTRRRHARSTRGVRWRARAAMPSPLPSTRSSRARRRTAARSWRPSVSASSWPPTANCRPRRRGRLGVQVDLDLVPASGLVIFHNAAALPPAAVVHATSAQTKQILAGTPSATASLGAVRAVPMTQVQGGWNGPPATGSCRCPRSSAGPGRSKGHRTRAAARVRVGHGVHRREGPRDGALRPAMAAHDRDDPARPGVGGRAVDHEEAGAPMRARGQGLLTVAMALVVVGAGVAFTRWGPRRRPSPPPGPRLPAPGSAPTAGARGGRPRSTSRTRAPRT